MPRAAHRALFAVLLAASPAVANADLGIKADLGVPDGFMTAVAYRPASPVTLHGGIGFNGNGPGVRIGTRVAPWQRGVTPFVSLEGGHYFLRTTPDWLRDTASDMGLDDKTLDRLGYTFVNGHLGFEIGDGSLRYAVQAGMSYIRSRSDIIKPKPAMTPPLELHRETIVDLWLISGQVGVLYYF